ncbi:hypothetical protein SAMN04488109_2326 [Chryseolinea serpens]|uniref:Uncharacterized protein n=1 Tax=Chryseolinea serpens TaxID=947013 RepID=A0A1M5NGN5_9BACT|nr:hypothetical protein SAMN04488109_2326 [Chryseolinea serpens]
MPGFPVGLRKRSFPGDHQLKASTIEFEQVTSKRSPDVTGTEQKLLFSRDIARELSTYPSRWTNLLRKAPLVKWRRV